ncbi:hypothetical protein, partial [Marinospirillum sp.]|uniref:hypothetical protein n=1 Tax=Marinospirillum sp. TaxID=2183934 RepID=UPI0025C35C90
MPGEAGKPGHLKEGSVTLTEGKTIRMARALLANGRVWLSFPLIDILPALKGGDSLYRTLMPEREKVLGSV